MKKISPRRTRAYAATTLAMVLVAAACGEEQNADPPATSAAVPNTTPPTILPPATSHPTTPATRPATSRVPSVDATNPSSNTIGIDAPGDEQVLASATIDAWAAFNDAVLEPRNDARLQALDQFFAGEVLIQAQQLVNDYRATNQREVTSLVIPGRVDVVAGSVRIDYANNSATVEVCRIGSNVRVETGGNPNGTDRVIDDTINAHRERTELSRIADRWLVTKNTWLESFPGARGCGN